MKNGKLSSKSTLILKLISEGHSYEQILVEYPTLTYLDIFRAAGEALAIVADENDNSTQQPSDDQTPASQDTLDKSVVKTSREASARNQELRASHGISAGQLSQSDITPQEDSMAEIVKSLAELGRKELERRAHADQPSAAREESDSASTLTEVTRKGSSERSKGSEHKPKHKRETDLESAQKSRGQALARVYAYLLRRAEEIDQEELRQKGRDNG